MAFSVKDNDSHHPLSVPDAMPVTTSTMSMPVVNHAIQLSNCSLGGMDPKIQEADISTSAGASADCRYVPPLSPNSATANKNVNGLTKSDLNSKANIGPALALNQDKVSVEVSFNLIFNIVPILLEQSVPGQR